MNKILILLVLAIFIAGCGSQEAGTQQSGDDISKDINEIDQLDKDLDIQGLDDLDKDLKDIENI